MAKLLFEDYHNEIDSLNLKLAAAIELAEKLKEVLDDIGGNKASVVNVSFDNPFTSSEDAKRMVERMNPLVGEIIPMPDSSAESIAAVEAIRVRMNKLTVSKDTLDFMAKVFGVGK